MKLVAENGMYVRAEFSGGVDGTLRPDAVNATKNYQSGWGSFEREDQVDGTTRIKVSNGHYLTAENGGGGALSTNRSIPGPYETFRFTPLPTPTHEHGQRVVVACHDGTHLFRLREDGNVDATGIPGMSGVVFLVQHRNRDEGEE